MFDLFPIEMATQAGVSSYYLLKKDFCVLKNITINTHSAVYCLGGFF